MTVTEWLTLALFVITMTAGVVFVFLLFTLEPSAFADEWAEVLNTSITTLNGASP